MKKIFALLLALVMISAMFVGCEKEPPEPTEITDPNVDETFKYKDLSITLPGDFAQENETTITNDEYRICFLYTPCSSITPVEGHPYPSLKTFMELHPSLFEDKKEVKEEGKLLYIDYATTTKNVPQMLKLPYGEGMQCMVGFKSDTYFWIVAFSSETVEYETVKEKAFEWAKTVTFVPEVEETN